jgi:hypothetical protein
MHDNKVILLTQGLCNSAEEAPFQQPLSIRVKMYEGESKFARAQGP